MNFYEYLDFAKTASETSFQMSCRNAPLQKQCVIISSPFVVIIDHKATILNQDL